MRGLFIAACALALTQVSTAHAEDVVRVGNLKLAHFGAISYIQEIAPQCGIKVDVRLFSKGPEIMQAMVGGDLDVGASASEAAISARANGTPIYVVAGFARGGARLMASPESGIKSVDDLKGKKVGVTRGSIQEVLLAAELGQHNLTSSEQPGKDITLFYLGYPDLNQALQLKQVDAIMQTEPQSAQALIKGFGVEVMKPYDTPIGYPVRTMVMSEKFYNEHKETALKFMKCFVTSTKTFMDHPEVARQYVTETLFKKQVSAEEFDQAIANSPYSFDITAEHIQTTTDVMGKYGVGKMSKPPIATEFVKLDLLDQAKKEVK